MPPPTTKAQVNFYLDQLEVDWYLNFSYDMTQVPDGANKVPFIWLAGNDPTVWTSGQAEAIATLFDAEITALGFSNPAEVRQTAISSPGSYWYMFGEPNKYGYITGSRFAPVFKYYHELITTADPTAKIIGPSILNWDWDCYLLCSYPTGESWLTEFVNTYRIQNDGANPPVDVWAIDTYPIDWWNTPNNDPDPAKQPTWKGEKALHSKIVTDQLKGMRQYLDNEGFGDTPIWITELAVHVGYDDWVWGPDNQLVPVFPYNWDNLSDYITQVLDWLEDSNGGVAIKIEKWFFFTPWKDIVNVGTDGYMGIVFFDGPDDDASLNCLGEQYRSRALQFKETPPQKVRCDSNGNTVPDTGDDNG